MPRCEALQTGKYQHPERVLAAFDTVTDIKLTFAQPLIRLNLSCHSPANSSQKTLRTRRADLGF